MRRRDLLAGTTGALCGLAGCTGSGFERLQTEAGNGGGDAGDDETESSGESEATETITVGDPDEVPFPDAHPPHELELRNEGETDRTVSVAVESDEDRGGNEDEGADGNGDGDDEEAPLFERDLDLPAGEAITVVLVEPRSYTASITATRPDGNGESSVTDGITRRPFDCTRSRTTVTLGETGTETESTSTTSSCPVPEVADETLEVGDGECAGRTNGDRATVDFADEAVTVDGAMTIPTPCHGLALAAATYDEGRDALEITVAVGEQEAETCVDCLGTAEYEARVDLEGRYPGGVEVFHERGGERERIAATEYSPDW